MVQRNRAPRRAMQWETKKLGFLTVGGVNQAFQLDESITRKGATVLRCVISFTALVPAAVTTVGWGTIVINTNMPSTVMPNPFTPNEVGWLCWDLVELTTVALGGLVFHRSYDTRSQRKYRSDDEVLRLVINSDNALEGTFGVRTLFALP